MNNQQLIAAIKKNFNLGELRLICYGLKIDYEEFGTKKDQFILDLLLHCDRHDCLPDLIEQFRSERPKVAWSLPKDEPPDGKLPEQNEQGNDSGMVWKVALVGAVIALIGTLAGAYANIRAAQIPIDATQTAEVGGTESAYQATVTAMNATAAYLTASAPPTLTLPTETPTLPSTATLPAPTSTIIPTDTPTNTPIPTSTPLPIQVFAENRPEDKTTVQCFQGEKVTISLPIDVEHTFLVENGNDLRWTSAFGAFLHTSDPASYSGQAVVYRFPSTRPREDLITIFRGDDGPQICELLIQLKQDE